jgi:hypothetical protein
LAASTTGWHEDLKFIVGASDHDQCHRRGGLVSRRRRLADSIPRELISRRQRGRDSGASGAGPVPNDLPIRIGAMHWTDSYHQGNDRLRGLADEVEYFGRALTAAEVTAMYAAGASGKCRPCAAAPSGMLSWWPGEGNAGDVIGTNDGLPQGGATFAPGRTGQAFSFDGADDHVDIPDSPGIHFTAQQPMSIAFWVKRTSASRHRSSWPSALIA